LRIAVTGASGQVGGQVVRLLAAEQPHEVLALSRGGLPSGPWPALAAAPASGRHHDITGPESLDLAEIAALATREWRTPLEYARITPSEHCAEMAIAGEDPWWMYAYSTMFASIREQRWAAVSDEIHRLTGCSPTPVRETLASYRAA